MGVHPRFRARVGLVCGVFGLSELVEPVTVLLTRVLHGAPTRQHEQRHALRAENYETGGDKSPRLVS